MTVCCRYQSEVVGNKRVDRIGNWKSYTIMFLYAPEETSGFKRTLGVGNASKQLSEDPGDIQSPVNTNQQTHTYHH